MRSRHVATAVTALLHATYAIASRALDPASVHLLHDAARYDAWAQALVAGRAFEPGAFSQAPLFPYLVAALYSAFGPHPAVVVAVNVLLGVATVAFVGRAAARAFGETAASWAAWLCALYGVLAFFETKLLPASLTVALTALLIERLQAADASAKFAPWALAGIVTGLLALTAASSLLLVPLVASWIALDRARGAGIRAGFAGAFVIAALAVVTPVTIRNAAAGGGFVPVADNGGLTFWHGNNPGSVGVYAAPEGFSGSAVTQRAESRRLAEAESGRPLRDDQVSAFWSAKGRTFLLGHPRRAAWLLGRKMVLALASTEQPLEYSPRLDGPLRFLMPVPFAVLLGLALLGAGRSFRTRAAQPALLVVAAGAGVLVVFYVSSRYRLPIIPGLALMAGAGAAGAGEVRLPGRLAAFAVVVSSLLWFPLTEQGLARTQDAMSMRDRASALRESGALDAAIATYERSLKLDPGAPFTHLDLAKALSRAGRKAEAERQIEETIVLAPDLAEAHFDLGVLAFESGRLEEAAASFAQAFRLTPDDPAAGNNLAGTYLKLGRVAEARGVLLDMRARGIAIDPPLLGALGA
jgi:tetratricopeptide (TPR) repeat protein